jgi:hypothetical protein
MVWLLRMVELLLVGAVLALAVSGFDRIRQALELASSLP